MKNKLFCAFLIVCLIFCLSNVSYTYACSIFPQDVPNNEIPTDMMQDILEQFNTEFELIEQKYSVEIHSINDEVLEMLKTEAVANIDNADFCFSELMSTLAVVMAQHQIDLQAENTISPCTERPIILNEETSIAIPYGVLKGQYITEVATGATTTQTGSVNITFESGTLFKNLVVSGGITKSVSYSINGPADGTYINIGNGESIRATHRVAMGILYGTVLKYDYDVYHPDTDYTHHVTIYIIDTETAATTSYTFAASIGIPTYSEKARTSGCLAFANLTEFRNAVEAEPEQFI